MDLVKKVRQALHFIENNNISAVGRNKLLQRVRSCQQPLVMGAVEKVNDKRVGKSLFDPGRFSAAPCTKEEKTLFRLDIYRSWKQNSKSPAKMDFPLPK